MRSDTAEPRGLIRRRRVPSIRRPWLAAVAATTALAAWGGGVGLVVGGFDFGASIDDRLPFDSPVLAGVTLIAVVAVPTTALAWSALVATRRTDGLALGAGWLLIGWIVGQVVVIRAFSWLQPLCLAVGVGFVAASHRVTLGPTRRGSLMVAVGSVVVAVGIGLLPHVIDDTDSVTSVVSVVAVVTGLASVGLGAISALRGRRWPATVAGSVASVVVVGLGVSTIAPAVAATNVPPSEITSTPVDHGLEFRSFTLTTADGVPLAAWHLPADAGHGAGVVVVHGAGSTRSDVLDQAAALVQGGYDVVTFDARGHGDSGGTAMDFGWYGDLDIAAATAFLASRPNVEPGRIGVVGFSMGGEMAIGAAAADGRVRAVVADGATARQAADKSWLSDVYGWRGRFQERVEHLQDGVTDYLTETSPPISLRDAVREATQARFLLIAAGDVADEGHAASYIESGASDRVTVWNLDGVGHTRGFAERPDEWTDRVLAFLDETLG